MVSPDEFGTGHGRSIASARAPKGLGLRCELASGDRGDVGVSLPHSVVDRNAGDFLIPLGTSGVMTGRSHAPSRRGADR